MTDHTDLIAEIEELSIPEPNGGKYGVMLIDKLIEQLEQAPEESRKCPFKWCRFPGCILCRMTRAEPPWRRR